MIGRIVEGLAKALAYLGGAILAVLSAMTVVSIIGRALNGIGPLGPVPGDYEMVANGCAIAVFFFLPYCQLKRGHVTVDIVVNLLPPRAKALFGLIGDAVIAAASILILRQLWLGFGEKFPYGSDALRDALSMGYKPFYPETTYELQMPVWILYGIAVLGAAVMVLVSLYTVGRAARWVLAGQEGPV